MQDKINLEEKFALFSDHWNPRLVGELNGQQVKLAKLLGEFIWHSHQNEDELFFVVKGNLRMEYRDHVQEIGPGEMIIVPRGVEHRPVAQEECWIMLFEPAGTVNTGEEKNEFTRDHLEKI